MSEEEVQLSTAVGLAVNERPALCQRLINIYSNSSSQRLRGVVEGATSLPAPVQDL